jgi:nuclear transport factor 2 (NTF2) superfamily protein
MQREPSGLDKRLKAYESAHNAHDVKKVMSFYTKDIRFETVEVWVREGKEAMENLEEWDAALNSNLIFTDVTIDDGIIKCKAEETNDWFKITGVEKIHYRSVVIKFKKGLIREIKADLTEESMAAIGVILQSIMGWALKERKQDLAELMPEGEFIYNAETAKKWMSLLHDWCEKRSI